MQFNIEALLTKAMVSLILSFNGINFLSGNDNYFFFGLSYNNNDNLHEEFMTIKRLMVISFQTSSFSSIVAEHNPL